MHEDTSPPCGKDRDMLAFTVKTKLALIVATDAAVEHGFGHAGAFAMYSACMIDIQALWLPSILSPCASHAPEGGEHTPARANDVSMVITARNWSVRFLWFVSNGEEHPAE
ncbi:MAG: hypothetical protein J2P36_27330 [Ktedonobacteraceae bacterium]|nr:hypothetical protein [Ktedonobacteraceae bacterium]